jgi:hypothetical protein
MISCVEFVISQPYHGVVGEFHQLSRRAWCVELTTGPVMCDSKVNNSTIETECEVNTPGPGLDCSHLARLFGLVSVHFNNFADKLIVH